MSVSAGNVRSSSSGQSSSELGRTVMEPFNIPPPPLSFYWGSIGLSALALVFLGILVFLALSEGADAGLLTLLVVGSGVTGIPAAILFVRRDRMACRIATLEQGVTVERRGVVTSIPFCDVEVLIVREKTKMNNGVPAGLERVVEIRGAFGSVAVQHFAQTEDLTVHFTRALIQGCAQAAMQRIERGSRLDGEGWSLSSAGLESRRGVVPLAEITAWAELDGKIQLWRASESDPFLAVPAASRNAHVLLWIVSDGREAAEESKQFETAPLGRLLFQRRYSMSGGVIALFVALICLASAVGLLPDRAEIEELIRASILALFGIAFAVCGVWVLRGKRRFYQSGLTVGSIFGARTVLYSEVTRFSWSETRQYINGAYAGTSIKAKVVPETGRKVSLGFSVSGADDALDMVREQVAQAVADRMRSAVQRGERSQWGSSAAFHRDTLEHKLPKLIGKGELRQTPYRSGLTFQIEGGIFSMFSPGDEKAVLRMACSEDNFWPGLILLGEKVQPHSTVMKQ